MRWEHDSVELDCDPARLAPWLDRIRNWLRDTYWAGNSPSERVRRSWERAGVARGLYARHGFESADATTMQRPRPV